jgi:hypothetical protein
VPCRCVPSAGCWAGSLVVRGKGLVVAKGEELREVAKITIKAVGSVNTDSGA